MKSKPANNTNILNRRARFDYHLGDEIVAGLELTGPEVRAIRDHRAQLKGAYVTIRSEQLWLNNSSISLKNNTPHAAEATTVSDRPIRLLAHKKQIANLADQKSKGLTIVPIKIITSGRHIKLVIALAKGKKTYDKRQTIKQRDTDRDTRRFLKNHI